MPRATTQIRRLIKPRRSAAKTGAYYKLRSKKYLEAQGYAVAFMERVMWIPPKDPTKRMVPVKIDQFGSDLLAMSTGELIFVQVKFGKQHCAEGMLAFEAHPFPPFAQRWLMLWERGAREPEIVDCAVPF